LASWKDENDKIIEKHGETPESFSNQIDISIEKEMDEYKKIYGDFDLGPGISEYKYQKYKDQYTDFDKEIYKSNKKLKKIMDKEFEYTKYLRYYMKNVVVTNIIYALSSFILFVLTIVSCSYWIKKYFLKISPKFKKITSIFMVYYSCYFLFLLIPSIILMFITITNAINVNLDFFSVMLKSFWFKNFMLLNTTYIFTTIILILPTIGLKIIALFRENKVAIHNIFKKVVMNIFKLIFALILIYIIPGIIISSIKSIFNYSVTNIISEVFLDYILNIIALIFLCKFYEINFENKKTTKKKTNKKNTAKKKAIKKKDK